MSKNLTQQQAAERLGEVEYDLTRFDKEALGVVTVVSEEAFKPGMYNK